VGGRCQEGHGERSARQAFGYQVAVRAPAG
jgi:hypothetical protein